MTIFIIETSTKKGPRNFCYATPDEWLHANIYVEMFIFVVDLGQSHPLRPLCR